MITSAFVPVAKPAPSPRAPITIAAAAQRGAPALATAIPSRAMPMSPRIDSGSSAEIGAAVDVVEHGCGLGPVQRVDDGGRGRADAALEQDDERAKHAEHAAGHRQARGARGQREREPDGARDEQDETDRPERHAGDHRPAVNGERGDLRGGVVGQGGLGQCPGDDDDRRGEQGGGSCECAFREHGIS